MDQSQGVRIRFAIVLFLVIPNRTVGDYRTVDKTQRRQRNVRENQFDHVAVETASAGFILPKIVYSFTNRPVETRGPVRFAIIDSPADEEILFLENNTA